MAQSRAVQEEGPDRRRWPRIPIPIPVFARGVDAKGKEFTEFTTALNFSAGGLLLVIKRFLPCSSQVSVEIPSAPLPEQSTVAAYLVRTLPGVVVQVTNSDRCYLCGVQFNSPLM